MLNQLIVLKTYNIGFDENITFTGKNGRLLQIKDNANLTLLIDK